MQINELKLKIVKTREVNNKIKAKIFYNKMCMKIKLKIKIKKKNHSQSKKKFHNNC